MIAILTASLFVAAAVFAAGVIVQGICRYAAPALAAGRALAAAGEERGFNYRVIEHRTLRGDVNVVVMPVRMATYRWTRQPAQRAAA
ncbi:hypothetical protein ACOYW6_02285 [Parablastomonas sp. CN1-191]|uniref:hypothetical protein n=1 Tax=Parablastomonas sp. CN1-191 TaxID=3400908 RepID=UPI003BF80FE6